jgi:hypothetical protein
VKSRSPTRKTDRVSDPVRDRVPPAAFLKVLNPVMRTLLRTAAGRLMPKVCVLAFDGRRTGRAYRVVAGCYDLEGDEVVLTSERWRLNFQEARPVTLWRGGQAEARTGTLDHDPVAVADFLNGELAAGTSAVALGLKVERGHRVTAEDAETLGRDLIRLRP